MGVGEGDTGIKSALVGAHPLVTANLKRPKGETQFPTTPTGEGDTTTVSSEDRSATEPIAAQPLHFGPSLPEGIADAMEPPLEPSFPTMPATTFLAMSQQFLSRGDGSKDRTTT